MNKYIKNVGLFTIAQLSAGVLGFVYTLFVARLLSVKDYGLFQALLGIFGMASIFFMPLSLSMIHCTGVTQRNRQGQVLAEFLRLALLLTGTGALLVAVFSPLIAVKLHSGGVFPVLIVASIIFLNGFTITTYGYLQGRYEYGRYSALRILQSFMTVVAGVILLFAGFSVVGALSGYLISMILLILYLLRFKKEIGDYRTGHLKREWQSVKSIVMVLAAIHFMDNLPMLVCRAHYEHITSGIYGALYNLRGMIWPIAMAIIYPFYTSLVSGEMEEAIFKKALILIGALGSMWILGGIFVPKLIILILYGKGFLEAAPYVPYYGLAVMLEMFCLIAMLDQIGRRVFRRRALLIPFGLLFLMLSLSKGISGLLAAQIISAAGYLIYYLLSVVFHKGTPQRTQNLTEGSGHDA